MFILKGVWGVTVAEYTDCQEYLTDYGNKNLILYINEYIKTHRPELPKFEISDDFRKYFEEYIKKYAGQRYVINPDGSYDAIRLNNLCIEAVADYLHI